MLTCLCLSMSFVSAKNNSTNVNSHDSDCSDSIIVEHSSKSFNDLKKEIDDSDESEFILKDDYTYHEGDAPILINRSLTIDGDNFCINANNTHRIFNILSGNVTLKNIVFSCGVSKDFNIIASESQKNGFLYWPGNNGNIINCTFVYSKYSVNTGTFNDLANEINNAENILVLDRDYVFSNECEYKHVDGSINNGVLMSANAVVIMGIGHDEEGIIINKTIIIDGRGHVLDGRGMSRIFKVVGGMVIFKNIVFRDGSSDMGSAIYGGSSVINSTFENNYCRNTLRYQEVSASIYGLIPSPFYQLTCYGGATYNVNATDCTFKFNHADYGGAMYGGNAFNCTFETNRADICGGAISNANAFNCTFKSNYAHKGAMYGGNAFNCTFVNNVAYECGGALYTGFASNCIFINNSAECGGACYEVSCDSCIFINNTASANGGAVCSHRHYNFIFSGDKISNSIFINNSAGCDGGAVWGLRDHAWNSSIDNCTFKNNKAMENGGAVYVAIIYNSTFINNTALNGGDVYGSIVSLISSVNASDTTFVTSDNHKSFFDLDNLINSNNQGEIYLEDDYSFDLNHDFRYLDEGICINCSVIIHGNNHTLDANNFSRFFRVYGDVVFENICFKNAKTSGNGGAINGLCTVLNSSFTNNYAYGEGGALYGVNCFNSSFIGNSAIHGGAVSCSNVSDSMFSNNFAHDAGAALNSLIRNSYFTFNHCEGSGGAVWFGESVNCVFQNNSAGMGGAICDCLAINSTFLSNSAGFGGAMQGGDAFNCVFISNSAFYNYGGVLDGDGGAIFKGSAFNCSFINNSAFDDGGAIFKGSAFNCSFINNYASCNGGAIYIDFDTKFIFLYGTTYIPFNATIDNCYFENNTSKENGGAVCTFENNTLIRSSVFINNNAKLGKDIYSDLVSIQVINSTYDSLYIRQDNSIMNNTGNSDVISNNTSKKSSSIIVAKNKVFNKKLKTKLYPVVLKSKNGKVLKNAFVTLKIKGKLFKAKTNSKGKATFKITKLTKKGKYKATIAYKGNNCYNKASKKVKLVLK